MSILVSPLAEADKESLAELFSRDPLSLADTDIAKIVAKLREQRDKWIVTEQKPKAAPKTKKAPDLSQLADLGF